MGYENRDYYRDSYDTGSNWQSPSSMGRSIVVKLIIINAVVFLLDMFSGEWDLMGILALDSQVYKQPWNIWQFLTYGFAHSRFNVSFFHIVGNMLVLFFLGPSLEQRLGSKEFLKFYLIAIVVSGLGYVLLKIGQNPSVTVGASGAVSAVLALFIFFYPRQKLQLFGIFPMPAWILGALLVVTDMFRAFDPSNRVAWQAHLAGFAFGAAYFYWNWNFNWLQVERIGELFKSRPKLRVHRAEAADEKLQQQADEILEKIKEHGEESLSGRERKILTRYSEKIRSKRE